MAARRSSLLLAGVSGGYFWTFVVLGLIIPLVLVFMKVKVHPVLLGVMILAGILLDKLSLLVAGQVQPWLPLPAGSYLPNWVELLGTIGALSVGWLVYLVLRPKEG